MDSPILRPGTDKPREIHPKGVHAARCVDVVDLGMRVKDFQGKKYAAHTIALVLRTGKTSSEGFALDLSQEFTFSLGAKANLRKVLEAWRGAPFTEEERGSAFDIVKEVGNKEVLISVVHQPSKDGSKTYANVAAYMPLPEGMTAPSGSDYKRAPYWGERKAKYAQEFDVYLREMKKGDGPAPSEDSDTPF